MWYNSTIKSAVRGVPTPNGSMQKGLAHMNSIPRTKPCSRCGVESPCTSEYFATDKRSSSGLASHCRVCKRAQDKSYREAHPGLRRQYYLDHKEHENESSRQYHEKNKSVIQARHAEYRLTDSYKASKKKHNQKPEVRALDNMRRKIRFHVIESGQSDLPNTITRIQWQAALNYFNGCCAVCEKPLHDLFNSVKPGFDHWQPVSKGGLSTVDNVVPLCHGVGGCNNSKKNNNPIEWLNRKFSKSKARQIEDRVNTYFEWAKTQ